MKRRLGLLLALALLIVGCDYRVDFVEPPAGTIVDTSTATLTGQIPDGAEPGGTITANGIAGTVNPDNTWSVEIPIDTTKYVTPVTAVYPTPASPAWAR
jgi:hypothetical protein